MSVHAHYTADHTEDKRFHNIVKSIATTDFAIFTPGLKQITRKISVCVTGPGLQVVRMAYTLIIYMTSFNIPNGTSEI